MEIAALLELLYSASERSQTVQATVQRLVHDARVAMGVPTGVRSPNKQVSLTREEGRPEAPPTVIEATTRLWAMPPAFLRWETDVIVDGKPAGHYVGLKQDDECWTCGPAGEEHWHGAHHDGQTVTPPEEHLLYPAPLLGAFRLDIEGDTTWLGRPAVSVRGTRRPGSISRFFWLPSDEVDLVVDRERGVLLRVSSRAAGGEVSRNEMTQIDFDEPIPDDLLRLPL